MPIEPLSPKPDRQFTSQERYKAIEFWPTLESTIVVLLLGGNKGSQDRDILIAKEYWRDYEQRQDPND
jgi:hypothetical protein